MHRVDEPTEVVVLQRRVQRGGQSRLQRLGHGAEARGELRLQTVRHPLQPLQQTAPGQSRDTLRQEAIPVEPGQDSELAGQIGQRIRIEELISKGEASAAPLAVRSPRHGLHRHVGGAAIQQDVLSHHETRVLRAHEGAHLTELFRRAVASGGDGRVTFGARLLQRNAL